MLSEPEPPTPLQVKVNVVAEVIGGEVSPVLEVDFPPDQPPEAVHEVALVDVHDNVTVLPETTKIDESEPLVLISTVGGGTMFTVTLSTVDVPPGPVQVIENVAGETVTDGDHSDPEVDLVPSPQPLP